MPAYAYSDNSPALLEPTNVPGGIELYLYGPGAARVLARSWTVVGSGSPPAYSCQWYHDGSVGSGAVILGCTHISGVQAPT